MRPENGFGGAHKYLPRHAQRRCQFLDSWTNPWQLRRRRNTIAAIQHHECSNKFMHTYRNQDITSDLYGEVCKACCRFWGNNCERFICKDCPNVMLCPPCRKQLMSGKVAPLVCPPSHEHLYLPSIDREAESALDPESMLWDGQAVPVEQWLKNLMVK